MEDATTEGIEFVACTSDITIKKEITEEYDEQPGASSYEFNDDSMGESSEIEPDEEDEHDDSYTEAFEPIVEIKEECIEDEGLSNTKQENCLEGTVAGGDESTSREQDGDVEHKGLVKKRGRSIVLKSKSDLELQKQMVENRSLTEKDLHVTPNEAFGGNKLKTSEGFEKNNPKCETKRPSKKKRSYKCPRCPFESKFTIGLERHISIHEDVKPFICDICNKAFNKVKSLNEHKYYHSGKRPFKCIDCPYAAATSYKLKVHIRKHTGEKVPRVCKTCGETFSSKYNLSNHVAFKHRGDKPLQCDQCSYATRQASDLAKHKAVHAVEKKFICDVCEKAFPSAARLRNHKLIHIDDENKKFKCTVCPYAASGSFYLKLHMATHTGEKKFACELCDKSYANKIRLKRHLSLVHNKTM